MVGTDQGNTYKGRQGTGFATIAPYNPQVDLSLLEMKKQEEALKQKKLMDAYGQMANIKPDNWYVHDQEMQKLLGGTIDLGASLIQKGEDPFTGSSDEAQLFQKMLVENTRYSEYSKQFKDRFSQVQTAYKNGEEIENWDEIVTWFHNPNLSGMVHGDYGQEPKPVFKKPEISVLKSQNEIWKMWDENNKGQIPTMDDAGKIAEKLISDPLYSGGFASTGSKQKQMYDSLPKAQKDAYEANGAANGRDGYTQYIAEDLYAAKNPYFNLEEDVLAASDLINVSEWELENDDVTKKGTSIKQSDAELRQILRGRLRPGAVSREVQQRKYGDPNKDITFNIKAAEDYYFPKFKKNIATKFSKTTDESGKSKKDEEASLLKWEDDFLGKNGEGAKKEAIAYLFGSEAYDEQTITGGKSVGGGPVFGSARDVAFHKGKLVRLTAPSVALKTSGYSEVDEFNPDTKRYEKKKVRNDEIEMVNPDSPKESIRKYYDMARQARKRKYGESTGFEFNGTQGGGFEFKNK